MNKILFTIFFLGIILFFVSISFLIPQDKSSLLIDKKKIINSEIPYNKSHHNKDYIEVLKNKETISQDEVLSFFSKSTPEEKAESMYIWSSKHDDSVNASAYGLDGHHHFVNSYLVGFEPFKTSKVWVPMYTISNRLSYEHDHHQYRGLKDVWQNPKETYQKNKGDCEDHALVLADWLISMKEDARVVVGKYKNQPHAWVVLFKNKQVFLLESTSKINRTSLQHYPVARYQPAYNPEYMFNRKYFWINQGSILTTNYESNHWVKKSAFYRKKDFSIN